MDGNLHPWMEYSTSGDLHYPWVGFPTNGVHFRLLQKNKLSKNWGARGSSIQKGVKSANLPQPYPWSHSDVT